ncbi:type VII toxin-antitoxin system MntA family adenylyltransferase antitoxin [Heliorestis convoluta]|nr:nucleotidyltransferase domain-containing protein [Heliorestis convoluta]
MADRFEMKKQKPHIEKTAQKYNLQLLILIGSYGQAHFRPGVSDIDLAFLSDKCITPEQQLQLIMDLALLFQSDKIDLINLQTSSGLMKFEVVTKGRLLYEKEQGDFYRYSLYAQRYYYDTKKFRDQRKAYLQSRLEG